MMTISRPRSLALFLFPLLAAASCDVPPADQPADRIDQAFVLRGDIVATPVGIYVPPPPPPPPVAPCLSPGSTGTCARTLSILGKVQYFGSYSLDLPNWDVKRAIIDIHGLFRNAPTAFDTMVGSAAFAESHGFLPDARKNTILIAPRFPNQEDGMPADFLHWTDNDWVKGGAAVDSPVSSYAVIDEMIARLNVPGRFPNLKKIIIAGHSAGGQFTHRYAAANFMDGQFSPIPIRYLVANPSSYLYTTTTRPRFDGNGFGVPYGIGCGNIVNIPFCTGFSGAPLCPSTFNDWHYGLEQMVPYANAMGAATLRQNLINRRVTLLLGTLDNDPNHSELDKSCPARLQGAHRLARGLNQMNYMNQVHPGHHTALFTVDGAGHDSQDMFIAPTGGVGTGSALLFSAL
jgi:hypothetical protein